MRPRDPLTTAAAAFVAANVVHTLDHVRQGTADLTVAIRVGGTALTILAILTLVLARRRHPWAAPVAVAVGFTGAAGILASHALPSWSALSDSYPEIGADALSWVVMLAEAGTALALGLVAVRAVSAPSRTRGSAATP